MNKMLTSLKPAMPRDNDWLTDEFIQEVETKKNCKFVGEFPLRQGSTNIGALFWQPNPPQKDYSQYFFLYFDHVRNGLFITSGSHMERRILVGVRTKNGHFIYSRGRHDYVEFDDSMVDGGDEYLRCKLDDTVIHFQILEDKLVELKNLEDKPRKEAQ